ncbi:hypothetical protein Angca_006396 [Angiostrongylus cantonensis]|nr:hypothetical protein Angca_006396 [Angiostrongylus cantonensis]
MKINDAEDQQKQEDHQKQQKQPEETPLPQSVGCTMRGTSPTIDVLSEASSSPPVSSSNSDSAVADCVVCGDKSSGKHYGQYSCEGCKSFFKRSIRRSLSYACRGTKNCPVDVNHRNQCQFCRLKKCVKMGMRRESVQQGRIHNGPPFPNCFFTPTFIPRPPLPFLHPFMLNFIPTSDTFSQITDSAAPAVPVRTPTCPSVRDIGTNLLYTTVDWVKQLSFFNMLSQTDQVTLLQHNWVQLFILCATGCSTPLTFKDELNVKEGNTYMEHVERLRSMHMDLFEMNSIKAIVLFNSG